MGALEKEHAGKVRFSVVSGPAKEIRPQAEKHGLGTHGLVGFAADGTPRVKIPGHDFGRGPEAARKAIEEKLAELLR